MIKYFVLIILLLVSISLFPLFFPPEKKIEVDMHAICTIESSCNPEFTRIYNPSENTRGLYQVSEAALTDFNKESDVVYNPTDLYNPETCRTVADWYINVKIPKYLKHFEIEDTIRNRIICYNYGIGNCVKMIKNNGILPFITQDYLRKYKELTNDTTVLQ